MAIPLSKNELEARVLAALQIGTIFAIGGMVYDAKMQYLCNTFDLVEIRHRIPFERIDPGGSPEWQLKNLAG